MKFHKIYTTLILTCLAITLAGCGIPNRQTNPATQTAVSAMRTLMSYSFLTPTVTQSTPAVISPGITPQAPEVTQSIVTPQGEPSNTPQPELVLPEGMLRYVTTAGDTLSVVAAHFGVPFEKIMSNSSLPAQRYLPTGTNLGIPTVELENVLESEPALPDSEIVYGPGTADFDLVRFAQEAGGFLTRYTETIDGKTYTGPQIVLKVARDSSTNPRMLLAFLEFRSNWVFGDPVGASTDKFPIGFGASDNGLYKELQITVKVLAQGFYGWRDGSLTTIRFFEGTTARIDPGLNAGSVAIQNLFATLYRSQYWYEYLYGPQGFLSFYSENFGDPWTRAAAVGSLVDERTVQPELALPFLPGLRWSLTAGAHTAWHTGSPRGALDFAPVTGEAACVVSTAWTTAAAAGRVVRSDEGVVAIDLDGDGDEGTGWVLIYLHIAAKDRVVEGSWVALDDRIGHPSCERGHSTGTHMHITRKYNGQWLAAEGPLPMILGGWQAFAGLGYYEGTLVRGSETVRSSSSGMSGSSIFRDD